ncbi:protein OXIDATIVE STRESS 3 LIKE 1-like [Humulus lupulus]|uniref:protein OXIDATIVE STRESS 3 LIKE 1-like n=1 Tax=Humulus lupulus TaxID=3486 RepID=UPI002B40E448|nr:protein OXIDATIVE STRESS 3 LIKE 1-like [Humulus lupulus]
MSLALQSNGEDTIRRQRFIHGMPCMSIYDSSDPKIFAGDRRIEPDMESCSSSSLGRNSGVSDESSNGEDSADDEVQSSFKGPLDTMDGLEEVLPIKRGISKFYNGKSKSFTSLSDATSVSSIKDFAKPENPYTRKRKNLIARSSLLDKNRTYSLKDLASGTSKRTASSSRSSFLLGEALNSSGNNINNEDLNSISTSPSCSRPPLHPHVKRSPTNGSSSPPQRQSPWRSFSLSDLQSVAAAASTANLRGLAISSGGDDE